MLMSVDGYVEDERGRFHFAKPDEEVNVLINPHRARVRSRRGPPAQAPAGHNITVNGPGLAAHALRAGLVDEIQMYVCPAIVGGGKPFFPDGVRGKLELLDQRRVRNGVVFLRYAVRG